MAWFLPPLNAWILTPCWLSRPGEELVHSYSAAACRPDRALLDYFFLPPPASRPLLCAVDLPGGVPWGDTPPEDAAHAPGCAPALCLLGV